MNEVKTCILDIFLGKTFDKIENNKDNLIFHFGEHRIEMYHEQDCCEYVRVEDIIGDLDDLIGSAIILA